ncbi:WPP domain-associated protein [Mercurialis annua]|uniref:WPP domain-associated protein n=1 Tax=Mercurialis annua TaxID=3986 RepID=UPI0024AF3C45|nr:WPP domain-associated protein [Mercurialis annua]
MDDVFGKAGGRFKISFIDSTMMWIVYRAMDKAQERAQSKEGVIECLTEISKFYELAVMQLEGCLKFVQEETDSSFESSDEEVLGDLAEIKDRLVGRLKESELAIAEKDKELAWRFENEMKLRKALEMKDKKLDALYAKLNLDPTKSNEGGEEVVVENQADEDRDEEFSGLKHSVEQQVWNIKQQLEPEVNSDRMINKSSESVKIEQMCSDIDILKETMDFAFGKMQSAILVSEMEPIEQQWRLTIERDALAILMKGFMRDIGRQKKVSCGLSDQLSDLIKEMKCLDDELGALCLSESSNEGKNFLKAGVKFRAEEDRIDEENTEDDGGSNYVAKLIKGHESIIKRKNKELKWLKRENTEEKGSSCLTREEDLVKPRRRIQDVIERMRNLVTLNASFAESIEDCGGSDGVEEGYSTERSKKEEESQLAGRNNKKEKVKKTLKFDAMNYEELQNEIRLLKEEKEDAYFRTVIKEKTYSAIWEGFVEESRAELFRRDSEILIRESAHEEYILQIKLSDNISKIFMREIYKEWNELVEKSAAENQVMEERYLAKFEETLREIKKTNNREISKLKELNLEANLREEMSRFLFGEVCKEWNYEELRNEVRLLKEEKEDSSFRATIMEKTYSAIWEGFVEELRTDLFRYDSEILIREGVHEESILQRKLSDDISKVFLREICKEWNKLAGRSTAENQVIKERYAIEFEDTLREIKNTNDREISKFKELNLEGKLREEMSRFLFGEVCKEWQEAVERSDIENHIYRIAILETLKSIANTNYCLESKLGEVKNAENDMHGFPLHNDSSQLIKYSVKDGEAHNFECLIREELFLFIIAETVKEANIACREIPSQSHSETSEDFSSSDMLHKSHEFSGEEILIDKEDSGLEFPKVEEDLILSASSDNNECTEHLSLIQYKHAKSDKLQITQELLTGIESSFTSVSSKVGQSLENLAVSKAIVNELRCFLGASDDDQKASTDYTESAFMQQKEVTPYFAAFTPLMEFSQVFIDFRCLVEEKIELNNLRLEEAMRNLNILADLVAKRRREERLYRKAFISRCQNLRKAETEVDLLGNQVEVLLVLLEKIYNVLHHYSPVLKNYFEVSDILKIISKELVGEVLGSIDK